MSEEPQFLIVTKARVTNIEFTFDGENPQHVVKRSKIRTGPQSIHPDNEANVLDAALDAFRKRYPIEIYQDRWGRIVKIQPSK